MPPPLGVVPNEIVMESQLEENALPPPEEATDESLGVGVCVC